VPILWPLIFKTGHEIAFAHTSFKLANLASYNAGVKVAIVGFSKRELIREKRIYTQAEDSVTAMSASNINPYPATSVANFCTAVLNERRQSKCRLVAINPWRYTHKLKVRLGIS
jgi:hypothetical protein